MSRKFAKEFQVNSMLVVDEDKDLLALTYVNGELEALAFIGPLDEQTVAGVELFAKEMRQLLTLDQAQNKGKLH